MFNGLTVPVMVVSVAAASLALNQGQGLGKAPVADLRFQLRNSEVTLHEPILATFSVTNDAGETIELDLGHDQKSNFEVSVRMPNGQLSPPARLSAEGLGLTGRISVNPGRTYSQDLLLNEWHPFSVSGDYEIRIGFKGSSRTVSGRSLDVGEPRTLRLRILSRDAMRLSQVCLRLAQDATSPDLQKAIEAAHALSFVGDPVAVPFLIQLIDVRGAVKQSAIAGLGRVANPEAIDALVQAAQSPDDETSGTARAVLYQIKSSIRDAALLKKVETIIGRD